MVASSAAAAAASHSEKEAGAAAGRQLGSQLARRTLIKGFLALFSHLHL
jgi:hypothetical protein